MDKYDRLYSLMKKLDTNPHVRLYSDGTAAVSAYVKGKLISMEGDYDLVTRAVEGMGFPGAVGTWWRKEE